MAIDDKSSFLSSIIGLPLAIGTQIPKLTKKGREHAQLRKMRGGQGAGAVMAREAGNQAARDALSVAGANTTNRGLALRTGLRAAEQARLHGAAQGSLLASQESQAATSALRGDAEARRGAIAQLGAGLAGSMAQFGAQKLAANDKEGALAENEANRQHELEKLRLIIGAQNPGLLEAGTPAEGAVATPERGVSTESVPSDWFAPGWDRGVTAQPAEGSVPADWFPEQQQSAAQDSPTAHYDGKTLGEVAGYDSPNMGVAPVDPIQAERRDIEYRTQAALGSPAAALMVASGLSPDKIIDQLEPGLNQRKLALMLMLAQGSK